MQGSRDGIGLHLGQSNPQTMFVASELTVDHVLHCLFIIFTQVYYAGLELSEWIAACPVEKSRSRANEGFVNCEFALATFDRQV